MTKQRAFATDINVTFCNPLLSINVDFVPVKLPDNSTKLVVVCPECPEPTRLTQRYNCDNADHGPFVLNEAARAREIDKVLYPVSAEEIIALKTPELPPEAGLALAVYPADEVAAHTIAMGKSYRLRPRSNLGVYSMLSRLVDDSTRAYIGEVNVRGTQNLFRVQSWNGQIVAIELVRPDELAETDEFDPTYDEKLLATAQALLSDEIQSFDPEMFRNIVRERAAALDESKRDPNAVAPVISKPKSDTSTDLLAQLETAMAATKKKTKKKAKV